MMDTAVLFDPIQIGHVTLRNRIVFAPMTTGYEQDGLISERSRAFYGRIARGGASLIVLGDLSIQPSLAPTPFVFDDRFIPPLRELTADVHAYGARIAAQLFHQEYDTTEIAAIAKAEGKEAALRRLHIEMTEYASRIAEDESPTMRPFLKRQLAHHEVTILTEHTLVEVRPGSVVVTAEGSATRHELRCDTVVSAVGTRRNAVLIDKLTDRGIRFLTVGDCAEDSTGTIAGAIHGGFNAALQI